MLTEKTDVDSRLFLLNESLKPHLVVLLLDPTSKLELVHKDENTIDIIPSRRVRLTLKNK